MKRSIVTAGVLVVVAGTVTLANEWVTVDPTFYVSGLGGPVSGQSMTMKNTDSDARIRTKTEVGVGALGAVGFDFGTARLEAEGGYQTANLDRTSTGDELEGDLSVSSAMLNGYLDFRGKDLPLVPYVTAGFGWADVTLDGAVAEVGLVDDEHRNGVLAWQIGAGFAWLFNSHWALDIRYRYFATGTAEYGPAELDFRSHNVYMGVRYSF